jgi:hypothetical protein
VTIQDEEKLIVMVVLVPVILALQDTEANHRFVNSAQCLVVPLVGAVLHQARNINDR